MVSSLVWLLWLGFGGCDSESSSSGFFGFFVDGGMVVDLGLGLRSRDEPSDSRSSGWLSGSRFVFYFDRWLFPVVLFILSDNTGKSQ